jgi:hypothetical protein
MVIVGVAIDHVPGIHALPHDPAGVRVTVLVADGAGAVDPVKLNPKENGSSGVQPIARQNARSAAAS